MITCLIIDDEMFAREELASMLSEHADIEILGQCSNAIEAVQMISRLKPTLIFLDIQMPRISGLELLAMLDPDTLPCIVFVTAYDEFAIKAFDNHAFDYLLKPIDENRLLQTLTRIRKDSTPAAIQVLAPQQLAHIPCYSGSRLRVISVKDVQYAFSDLTGIHVGTDRELVHTQLTLRVLEEKTCLVRCHRQYLVNPDAVSEIDIQENGTQITTLAGVRLPVSRRYLKSLKQLFGFH